MTETTTAAGISTGSRPIPTQRTPRSAVDAGLGPAAPVAARPRVVTFHDGTSWTYRIDGEASLGHHFADRAPAVAAGTFLARSLQGELVVEDRDGAADECLYFGDRCSCHDRDGTAAGD